MMDLCQVESMEMRAEGRKARSGEKDEEEYLVFWCRRRCRQEVRGRRCWFGEG